MMRTLLPSLLLLLLKRAQLVAWPLAFACALAMRSAQAQVNARAPITQACDEETVLYRYAGDVRVDAFIDQLAARYRFDAGALRAMFAHTPYVSASARLVMPAPPAQKDWHAYQARVLEPARIVAGARFWRAHQAALLSASQKFGVPPEIIVGIIGLETNYGQNMGCFRTLDVLTTLAFDYPLTPNRSERIALYRQNLEDFLIWVDSAGLDPASILGSYAGAIGIAQFLPSSILRYTVSDGDNALPDLRTDTAAAIDSIANFLQQHGWRKDQPIVWKIAPDPTSQKVAQREADGQPEPHLALGQLLKAGLRLDEAFNASAARNTQVTIVDLPTPRQPVEYMLGLRNFYVLTRYNRSFFYALAVYQLGQKVKQQMVEKVVRVVRAVSAQ